MTRLRFSRTLVAALLVGALVASVLLTAPEYLSPARLLAHRDALLQFGNEHHVEALVVVFFVYAAAAAIGVPGGLVFSLACGLLFGRIIGTLVAAGAETFGSTLAFVAARHLFADAARRRLGATGERIDAGFVRHAWSYLLFLRIMPLFPFVVVNLGPALTSVRLRTFIGATLLGAIPATFLYANLGQTLGRADTLDEVLSPKTLGTLALLGLLALVPALVRRRRRSARDA